MNLADVGSRGITPSEQGRLHFWLRGPDFLLGEEWPAMPKLSDIPSDDKELQVRSCFLHGGG
jgi:hypothetical protein